MRSYLTLCLLLLFWGAKPLSATESPPLDFSEFAERVYLVHVTPVLLHDSIAIGGGLTNNKIIPHDKAMRHRTTFHTCLGGMVPQECMISRSSFYGLPVYSSVKDHNETPYAYLEPLEAFEGECIGGQLNDCFIFDRHKYGYKAIIVLPVADLNKFWETNSNFEGEIVTYDPKTTSLRDVVNTTLEQKQAWRITFEGERGGLSYDYSVIKINGTEIDSNLVNKHFKKCTLYQGNHNYSRFGIIESLLGYLNRPFVHFYLSPKTPLWKTLIPSTSAMVLRSLVEYQFNKLSEEIQGLSKEKHKAFFTWQEETRHWVDLYFRLLRLGEEKKAFDKLETFDQLIAERAHENELELIEKRMPVLEKPLIIGDPDDLGLLRYVPDYWDALSYMPLGDIQEGLNWVEKEYQSWDKKSTVSAYLFFKKIFRSPLQLPEDIDSSLVLAFSESANDLSSIRPSSEVLKKGVVEFFRDEFFELFDKPEKELQLFALMNISGVKFTLSILLHTPSWNEKEVLNLEDILSIAPATKQLYGEQTDYTRCVAFVRPSLLKVSVKTMREANNLNAAFCGFLSSLSRAPLNKNGIKDDILGKIALSMFEEAQLYFDIIKSGRFGSLDEIFAFYNVKNEFREAYPTDDNFWNVPADWTGRVPTFEHILNNLLQKKIRQ
jgi:hypothetical protein